MKLGEPLFEQGQPVGGLFCIAEGLIRVRQRGKQVKPRFVRLVLPGDTAGHRSLFTEEHFKGTATVISERVSVCFVPSGTILTLIGSSTEFAKSLLKRLSGELDRAEEDQVATKEKSVRGRLAQLIWTLCESYSESGSGGTRVLRSEISKVDIARMLSVADETVIRLMTEFKRDGVIDYSGRRIRIISAKKLQALAVL